MIDAETRGQFLRYAMVGVGSNLILYFLYLAFTGLGLGHKLGMSIVYIIGVTQTFLFNRSWSFRHQGARRDAFVRYVATYAIGYFVNLAVLWIAVDHLGLPHQLVQGVMILSLAVMLFLLQKYWVFSEERSEARSNP